MKKRELLEVLNSLQAYSNLRNVHLDIRAHRKLSINDFIKTIQKLQCNIYIEVRNEKHLAKIPKKYITKLKNPSSKDKKAYLLKNRMDSALVDKVTKFCVNWFDVESEIDRYQYPDYEPFDSRTDLGIDVRTIVENNVGLRAVQYERTAAKKIFIDKIAEVLSQ